MGSPWRRYLSPLTTGCPQPHAALNYSHLHSQQLYEAGLGTAVFK